MKLFSTNVIFYSTLAFTIFEAFTPVRCESYIDEDTIVIEAQVQNKKVREKRQALLVYPQQTQLIYPQQIGSQQGRGQRSFPQQGQWPRQGHPPQNVQQWPRHAQSPQNIQQWPRPGQQPQNVQQLPRQGQQPPNSQQLPRQGQQPQNVQQWPHQGQPPQNFPGQSSPDGSPCRTQEGSEGQCSSLGKCYPNIFIQNHDVANLLLRNLSACASPANNFLQGGNQNVKPQICCPMKRTARNIDVGSHANRIEKQKLWNSIPMHLRTMVPPNVTPVPIKKYPWTVAIMQGDRHHCGGSLISKFTVLTAAHCLYNMDAAAVTSLRVLLGHHDISRNEQSRATVRNVVKAIFHKEFSMRTLHNDIGLLILDYSVPMADNLNISPVKLNWNSPPVSGKAMIAGWGQMGWNLPATPNLMETTIDIWTNRKCAAMYGPLAPGGITNHMICGSAVGKDACRGDSGSPLMISGSDGQTEQIGVVSWGIECGRYPSVHTRLASYYPWVQKNRLD